MKSAELKYTRDFYCFGDTARATATAKIDEASKLCFGAIFRNTM